jgi:hypothetical protein
MKIAITHAKNPLIGWNIDVKVNAEKQEKIAFVEIRVNGFPEVSETQGEPEDSWERQLTQQGVFPGDNKVEVLVRDQNSNDTRAKQAWTGN